MKIVLFLLLLLLISACSLNQEFEINSSINDSDDFPETILVDENNIPDFEKESIKSNDEVLVNETGNISSQNNELIENEPFIDIKTVEVNDGKLFYQYSITNPSSSVKEITHGVQVSFRPETKLRSSFISSTKTMTFSDAFELQEGQLSGLKIIFNDEVYEYKFNKRGLEYTNDYGSFEDLNFEIQHLRNTQEFIIFKVIFENTGPKTIPINLEYRQNTPGGGGGGSMSGGSGGYRTDLYLAPYEYYSKEVKLTKSQDEGTYELTYTLRNTRNGPTSPAIGLDFLEKTGYYTVE